MLRIVVCVIAVAFSFNQSRAATFEPVTSGCFYSGKCADGAEPDGILLNGPIIPGDADAFRDILKRAPHATKVILRSQGGNAAEAIVIGREIRDLLLETDAPELDYRSGAEALEYHGGDAPRCDENRIGSRYKGTTTCACASACFFIYAGGAHRNLGYVGVHRAYLNPEIAANVDLGHVMDAQRRVGQEVAQYLREMNVGEPLIDAMARTSSKEIYTPVYPIVVSSLLGWVPDVEEWLIAKCQTVGDREFEEQETVAYINNTLTEFFRLRDARQACIENALAAERDARRTRQGLQVSTGRR